MVENEQRAATFKEGIGGIHKADVVEIYHFWIGTTERRLGRLLLTTPAQVAV
jgi:hypothetical protein